MTKYTEFYFYIIRQSVTVSDYASLKERSLLYLESFVNVIGVKTAAVPKSVKVLHRFL